MSRELLIMRHAKSDWDGGDADFDRPLTRRGKADAPKVGAWLAQEGLVPDHVVSSPARRAHQTALRLCKALGIPKGQIDWDPRVYDADLDGLLEALGCCPPDAPRVLLIGHNPGLETLLLHLADAAPVEREDGKLLTTAALARLTMPEHWTSLPADCAQLICITRPRDLQGTAPQ